jgi:hypothetical protein
MKRLARLLMAGIGLVALPVVGSYLLIESGEVVVLRTAPRDGHRFLARLWVVDHGGAPWISTTDPSKTDWVPWLREHPRVELERRGTPSCRRAAFDAEREIVPQLNAALDAKYRVASYGSSFLKLVAGAERDDDQRVWIRLEPCLEAREEPRAPPSDARP